MQAEKAKFSLARLDGQIRRLQQALAVVGPMRPGTLTRQYRDPQRKRGAYYQLSYTFQMRSHTEYVRRGEVPEVRRELACYRRYKRLTARWLVLALRRAKLRLRLRRAAQDSSPEHPKPSVAGGPEPNLGP